MDWELLFGGLGLTAGVFVANFWVWRRMREEYEGQVILGIWIKLVLAGAIGGMGLHWLVYRSGGIWIWGVILGSGGALLWMARGGYLDFWEWVDAIVGGWMWGGVLVSAGGERWTEALGYTLGIVVSGYVRANFRKWRWYESGKSGVAGLIGLMWAAGVWIAVAKNPKPGLYWSGLELTQWVGVWAIVAIGVTVYLRGGRRTTKDLSSIWQKIKIIK